MIRRADAVIDFLKSERERGVTHIYLDQEVRDALRVWYRRTRAITTAAVPGAGEDLGPTPKSAEKGPSSDVVLSSVTVEGGSKAERLASLRQLMNHWEPVRALGTLRGTLVFSTGDPDARLMLLGDAPGHEEEKKGEPFAGLSGQKLDAILNAMRLTRGDVYLSHIVKFRPMTARQATNDRKARPEEMAVFLPLLRAEIGIVRPGCIVAFGSAAAEGLLGISGTVAEMRGSWYSFDGIPVRVTHHPAALLNSNAELTYKRQLWEDMLLVMEELIMPISAKQRGFFPGTPDR
jgi:DNA polymerase